MFEDLFGQLEATFTDIVESQAFQVVIYVIVAYIVLIWLASAFWAYRDMRLRSASAITPYVAALAIILFTPVFFLFGLLLYRIIRPKETIAEVNERALAEEAMLAEVASHAHCANCSRPVHEEWIICPTCRTRLNRVCANCGRLVGLDWSLCAWCGKDFERGDIAAYEPIASGLDDLDRLDAPTARSGRPGGPRLFRSPRAEPGGTSAPGPVAEP